MVRGCVVCSTPLTGKQKRYCSKRCKQQRYRMGQNVTESVSAFLPNNPAHNRRWTPEPTKGQTIKIATSKLAQKLLDGDKFAFHMVAKAFAPNEVISDPVNFLANYTINYFEKG